MGIIFFVCCLTLVICSLVSAQNFTVKWFLIRSTIYRILELLILFCMIQYFQPHWRILLGLGEASSSPSDRNNNGNKNNNLSKDKNIHLYYLNYNSNSNDSTNNNSARSMSKSTSAESLPPSPLDTPSVINIRVV